MKKYTKIICMIAAVCLLGTAAFCSFHIYSHYAHESEQEEAKQIVMAKLRALKAAA